jgi:uncharacterized membrane protein YqiK
MFDILSAIPFLVWLGLILVIVFFVAMLIGDGFVFIANDSYGIVERKWSMRGSGKKIGFMTLGGDAGFLPEIIQGGWHRFMPFMYKVHKKKLITVRNIGYIFARTGEALPNGQALAAWPVGVDPRNAREFLDKGGQEGPQRHILRAASYAINTALFVVLTEDGVHEIPLGDKEKTDSLHQLINGRGGYDPVFLNNDKIGVVTVHDGPALEHGEIIAPSVGTDAKNPTIFHNGFQDIQKFLVAGGRRGQQEQVLTEGTYYINRLFATIEFKDKTFIEMGNVGVVVSYTGPTGEDTSGDDYKHGQLVKMGERGVWNKPLQPGKYAFNPYAYKIRTVPTTNFQLRWIENATDSHNFDANLSEIMLITKDAFEPILPLSIVVHIGQEDAPFVVQQFAEINKLVDQTLDPMVSAWFKDAAQSMTLIELVSQRAELQKKALSEMQEKFKRYRLNVKEVMIGTPRASPGDVHIDAVFEQLRTRQVAKEKATTYQSQQEAATKERELNEARAIAEQQSALTASKVAIDVAENSGQASLRLRQKEAEAMVKIAEADAKRVTLAGEAEAGRIRAVGQAEADATEATAKALGGPQAALTKAIASMLSDAVKNANQPLVPGVVMGTNTGGETSNPMALLMALLIKNGSTNDLSILHKGQTSV